MRIDRCGAARLVRGRSRVVALGILAIAAGALGNALFASDARASVLSGVVASISKRQQRTPLDQFPRPITLVELLYEATRTLDASGGALAAIGEAYSTFDVEWKLRITPKSRRMMSAAADAADHDSNDDDSHFEARARALADAWSESDALHEALVARIIEACVATGAPIALDATAQANFRCRIAHRVAFSDGTSLSIDRLPIVTTPCVDLAIAVGHPRIQQRVPRERRAAFDALLSAEWPRILREHRELRRIGFKFDAVEQRASSRHDADLDRAAAQAADDAMRAIARLARANLAANLAFADRVESEIGIDAADALRVELISNACRDGGFATAIAEPWQESERLMRALREGRSLDVSAHEAAERAVREERHRFVMASVAAYRAFLADDRAFTSGLAGSETDVRAQDALLRGDHPFTEMLVGSFRNAMQASSIEEFAARVARISGIPQREGTTGRAEAGEVTGVADAGFNVDTELRADWRRFGSASEENLMAHEDESERESARLIQQGYTEGTSEDVGGDALAAAPRLTAADLRRAVGALRLDGVVRPKDELDAVLAAFITSEPTAAEVLTRRADGAPGTFGEVDATVWRNLPEDLARENAFHVSRMQTLRGAFDLPERSAAAAVLSLERLDYFLGRPDMAIGLGIPDDILAIATAAGIGIDDQRKLFVAALPALEALIADLPAFAERFRDAALADERAELAARAAFKARTGEEEGRMDVVERGGTVEDARGRLVSEIRLATARILLDAAWSIELDTIARLRFSLRIVERLTGCATTGVMSASRTIRVLRGAASEDASVVARLDRCEQTVLEAQLVGFPPLGNPGADVQQDSADRKPRSEAAWKLWWEEWCANTYHADAPRPFIASWRRSATEADGRRMLLMLQAVDGAPNERHLQRIIAYAFSMELGRLRQTPFAEGFFP